MKSGSNIRIAVVTAAVIALTVSVAYPLFGQQKRVDLLLHPGQANVITSEAPVKKVAIADPEIADATVISAHQILLIGKTVGTTNFIVWDEEMQYAKYTVNVRQERASHQIMLEVRFLEVNKSALKEFGSDFLIKGMKAGSQSVDVHSYGGKVGEPGDPLLLGNTVDMFLAIPTQNFSMILKALQENNLLTVLASPTLSAISGSEAEFLAGGEFPIPIVSGSMGTQTVTIVFKEYGVRLKFLPTILDSQIVHIGVNAEVSSLDFENGVTLSGFEIPSLVTRKAQSTVELKEGEHLIIGGLFSSETAETISKIPLLGSIPILGKLFSSKKYQQKESELLISLSPRINRSLSADEIPESLSLSKTRGGE
ncbi:pilus assembly protein N-terminal domain-containing protein [bacterium]|nr:pilus assembly protein N-terminal domain-containing protein [bacterium]